MLSCSVRLSDRGPALHNCVLTGPAGIHCIRDMVSSSKLIGFVMWSFIPASRLLSRSPLIACAVIARMGRLRKRLFGADELRSCQAIHHRHLDVHQYQVKRSCHATRSTLPLVR